jgi:hypothetical protein
LHNYWNNDLATLLKANIDPDNDLIYGMAVETVEARAVEYGLAYNVTLYEETFTSPSTTYYLLRTGTSNNITLNITSVRCIDIENNKEASLHLDSFEAPTVTTVGDDTGMIIANLNRTTDKVKTFTLKSSPTISDEGTQLFHSLLSSSAPQGTGITWQLKPDTEYHIKISNNSGVTCSYSVGMTMYELISS